MEEEEGVETLKAGAGLGIRHYVLGQRISMEEDVAHEFKGHRSISIHDIQNICFNLNQAGARTRNAISITIGAMLNSGQGGTIYLGVTDSGIVKGITLTRYQQDHVEASLEWTLGKFTPPVPDSRYSVAFVPVISSKSHTLSAVTSEHVDNIRRNQPHHVAQPYSCWCDVDAEAQQSLGKLPVVYVVEIHVRPWEPHNIKLCLEDIRRLLVHRVQEHCTLKLDALQQQFKMLQDLAEKHGIQLPLQTEENSH
ncbi:uncharacterized protein [Panulirus ornatus]|uniref:uncharacterized protein isoform X2 n=1 Tax=Panulirus ornatus TaxID=150431 RepID=UPI003A86EE6B